VSYNVFHTRGRKRNQCYGTLQQDVTFHCCDWHWQYGV